MPKYVAEQKASQGGATKSYEGGSGKVAGALLGAAYSLAKAAVQKSAQAGKRKSNSGALGKMGAAVRGKAGNPLLDNSDDYWSQKYGAETAAEMRQYGVLPSLNSSLSSPFYQPYIEQYGLDTVKEMRQYGVLISQEEQSEASSWMERFQDYESKMRNMGSFLNSKDWKSSEDQQKYRDMVDGYLKELSTGIAGMKEDSMMKGSAMEYYKYWQQVSQGLKDKQDFLSQFKDKNQYQGYKAAALSQEEAKAAGKNSDEWYQSVQKEYDDANEKVKVLQSRVNLLSIQANGTYDMAPDHSVDKELEQAKRELEKAQKEASGIKTKQQYASAWRYQDIKDRKDFTAKLALGNAERERFREESSREYKAMLDQYAEYGISKEGSTDIRGDYYATNKEYLLPSDKWTQEQKDTHAYLFATDRGKADEYARQTNDMYNAQTYLQKQKKLEEWAGKNVFTGALSTGASLATTPMSFFDYLDNVVEYRERGVTTQRKDMTLADYGNVMTGAVAEKLNEKGAIHTTLFGDVSLGDAYQLGNSILQSVVYAHTLGAAGTSAAFFGSAAKSGFEDAKARGVSDGRALAYGFASGLAEAGCEYVSVDKLLTMKTPKGLAGYLKNTLVQAGIEGSEEGLTTLCNTVSDAWINGDKSELELKIQEYMEQGMSHSKAEKQALKEWMQGIASEIMGGAISGGISTGGEMLVRSATHTDREATMDLVEQGMRSAEGSEARQLAEHYAERFGYTAAAQEQAEAEQSPESEAEEELAQNQEREQEAEKYGLRAFIRDVRAERKNRRDNTLSMMQADQLAQAIEEQDLKIIADAAQARLEALGVTENTSALAEAIAAYAAGEKLTRAQRLALSQSEEARRVQSEIDPGNMRDEINAALSDSDATQYARTNEWAKNIGTTRINADIYNGDVAESFQDLLRSSKARGSAEKSGSVKAGGESQQLLGLVWHEGTLSVKTKDSTGKIHYTPPAAAQIKDPGTADFVQELAANPKQYKNAPVMYELYEPGQDIGAYLNAWNMAENVLGYSSTATLERAAQESGIKGVLNDAQLRTAFDLGRSRREQERAERKVQESAGAKVRERDETTELRQGSVSFAGGVIDGVSYKAVNQSKLSGRRRAQVDAITMFAEATGIDVVFYESGKGKDGKYQGANGVYHDGKIWLDVNAGLYGANAGRLAIVRTAGHELTHYIQENSPELYEELKTFLVDHLLEWKDKSLNDLVNEKLARDSTGNLDFDGAMDEVVADGCEMMLKRSSAVETLARENRTLFDRIHAWLRNWVTKIRKAFVGVEAYHEEAKAMLDYMDQLQAIWDRALVNAAENASRSEAVSHESEAAASDGGRVQYEIRNEFYGEFDAWDGKSDKTFNIGTTSAALRSVGVDERRIILHSRKAAEILREHPQMTRDILKQVPDLLEHPVFVLTSKQNNTRIVVMGEVLDSAGNPVTAVLELEPRSRGGQIQDFNVLVSAYGKDFSPQQFVQDSGLIYIDPNKNRTKRFMQGLGLSLPSDTITFGSVGRISYSGRNVNIQSVPYSQYMQTTREDVTYSSKVPATKTAAQLAFEKALAEKSKPQMQERDFVPDDRELLLEAASKRGSSAELKAYRKKYGTLESLHQKLERQQTVLAEAEEQDKSAVRRAIAKTEAQIERAEAALAKMEASPVLKEEARKGMAAWREENPNRAAETLRRLREVNRALEKDLAYWKAQAKRTEPGEHSVRPEDVRRMARQLIKEYSSQVELEEITSRLQELGDYIVSGGEIAYEDVRRMAREISALIIDTAYTQEDDSADLRSRVREYLRGTKLKISDELRGDMTDLDYFRKHNMGTLRLGKEGLDIDVAYMEMQEMFGEGLFPKDVTAHGDMLNQILDALESLEPIYVPVFQRTERNEAAALLSTQIIDRMISSEIRQSYTETDRAYQAMGQRVQEAERRAADAEQKLEDVQRTAAYDRRAALQNLRKDIATRQEKRQKRINIDRVAKRLGKWLTENSAKNHVPEKMKKRIGEFLLSIDLAPGGNSKEARNYERRMRSIQDVVIRQQKFLNGQTENWSGMYLDLPAFLDETIQEHLDALEESNDGEVYDVKSMGLEQLEQLEEILTAVSKAVTTANDLMADVRSAKVSDVGETTIDHLDRLGRAKRNNAVKNFLQFQNTTPYYFFKRFGSGGEQIFRELQEGWNKLAFNAREIIEYAEDAYSSEEAKRLEKDTITVKLHKRLLTGTEGDEELRSKSKETVTLTRAQAMEIYALSRRKQALGHLLGAGIRIADIKQGALKKIVQADNYLLDLEDIAQITGKLSKREKQIAETLQKHMNTRGSEWGNEVSMARFGIRQFTEENYWPISTDSRTRPVRDPGQDSTNLFRLLNMSFTKSTIRDAHNAVVIGSAFDTYSNHMADMAKYNALGLALLDTMKWMSYSTATDTDADGHYTTTSVQKSAERAFGAEALRYFTAFMKDMNGTHEAGRGEELSAKMISNYKVAAVGANLRVIALQPTAFVRAAAVMDSKYLRKGLAMSNKLGREEAMRYSGTAVWKALGFYDTNINKGLREMIKHTESAVDKLKEKAMWGAENADKVTWAALWNACKAEVQEKQGLRGEALMKATAERFDEVVYRTQVMDSTMTRSHNMRQKGVFASMNTAFMSEPTLSYNMLLDAYNEYQTEKRRSGNGSVAWKVVKGYVGRALATYVATQVAASIVESLVDAMRDDDEFQSYVEKWLEAQFGGGKVWEGNLLADLNPFNKLPYVKEIDALLTGYNSSTSRMDTAWMASLLKAYNIVKESTALALGWQEAPTDTTYNGKMSVWGKTYNILKALSQVSGLPGGNLGRELVSVANFSATVYNDTVGTFTLRTIKTYEPGRKKSIQYAVKDGYLTEEEAVELLLKTDFDGDEDDARQQVYEWSLGEEGKYDALLAAVKAGDQVAFKESTQVLEDYGYSEKGIRKAVRSAVKDWYQKERSIEKRDAIRLLQEYGGKNQREAEETVQKWTALVTAGIDYDDIGEQFLEGKISAERARDMYVRYGGMEKKDAEAEVQKIQCEIDTGYVYDDIRDEFLYGELSEAEAVELRVKYGGATRENSEKLVRKWSCERDTGIRYDDIEEEYVSGNLSAYDTMQLMQIYGGLSADKASDNIVLYDFVGDSDELSSAYTSTAKKYYEYAEAAGFKKEEYYRAYLETSSLKGDQDEKGNTIKYSQMKKRMEYINSLNLSSFQKDALFLCFYSEKNLKKAPWR